VSRKLDKRTLASNETKTRLLDAAELLFAEHGLNGVSLRTIAEAAHVDVALIQYHFSSKLGLFKAVFHRRADPLKAMRFQALQSALPRSRGRPDLERVVYALAAPNVYLRHIPNMGGEPFGRLLVRELTDPTEKQRGLISETFDSDVKHFVAALSESLPGAQARVLHWAFHFAIGTVIQAMASTGRLEKRSNGQCHFNDPDSVLRYLVPFITHGILGCVRHGPPKPRVGRRKKATGKQQAAHRETRRPTAASRSTKRKR
jgi:AcrR family transcriptional regulator